MGRIHPGGLTRPSNPIVGQWLAEAVTQLGHAVLEDVLDHRVVDQSEPAFIAEARRQGPDPGVVAGIRPSFRR